MTLSYYEQVVVKREGNFSKLERLTSVLFSNPCRANIVQCFRSLSPSLCKGMSKSATPFMFDEKKGKYVSMKPVQELHLVMGVNE